MSPLAASTRASATTSPNSTSPEPVWTWTAPKRPRPSTSAEPVFDSMLVPSGQRTTTSTSALLKRPRPRTSTTTSWPSPRPCTSTRASSTAALLASSPRSASSSTVVSCVSAVSSRTSPAPSLMSSRVSPGVWNVSVLIAGGRPGARAGAAGACRPSLRDVRTEAGKMPSPIPPLAAGVARQPVAGLLLRRAAAAARERADDPRVDGDALGRRRHLDRALERLGQPQRDAGRVRLVGGRGRRLGLVSDEDELGVLAGQPHLD